MKPKYIYFFLSFFFSLILLNGCLSVKRIEKNCDQFAKICVVGQEVRIDTVIKEKTTILYKDTIVYVTLNPDTVYKSIKTKIPFVFTTDTLVISDAYSISSAWVYKSKLQGNLVTKDTTLTFRLKNAIKEATYWKEKYITKDTTESIQVPDKKPTRYPLVFFIGLVIGLFSGAFFRIRSIN